MGEQIASLNGGHHTSIGLTMLVTRPRKHQLRHCRGRCKSHNTLVGLAQAAVRDSHLHGRIPVDCIFQHRLASNRTTSAE